MRPLLRLLNESRDRTVVAIGVGGRAARRLRPEAAISLLLLLLHLTTPATSTAQSRPALVPRKFAGTVQIAGEPADPGTSVQIVTFRADRTYTVCGDTTVQLRSTGAARPNDQVAGYEATLNPTPGCLNPDNSFSFYVNGVYAGGASTSGPVVSPNLVYNNLSVSEVALKTAGSGAGLRLVWFYGRVRDFFGRPAPPGTMVIAESKCASGRDIGMTTDLYWVPKFPGNQTIGEKGFYWIGIDMNSACADLPVMFTIRLEKDPSRRVSLQIRTPPYGRAQPVPDLVLPLIP